MKSKTFKPTAAAVLAFTLSLGTAFAQTSGSTGGSAGTGSSATGSTAPMAQPGTGTRQSEAKKDDKLARADRKFIEEAAGSGMFEVQAAQLASTKATDPGVKSLATMLVDHHTKANSELSQLANSKGVELPAAPPRSLRNDVEKMGKKSGNEFDQDFVRNVGIKAHEKDIKMFEKASKDAKDPELKAFVDKTLPQLKEHLAMAQKLPQSGKSGADAASMGNTGSGSKSSASKTGG